MALFFNQRKSRGFNYTPRYYSPEEEAREERKRIVLGEKYKAPTESGDSDKEYVPGSYLRQHVQNRRQNMAGEMMRRRRRKRRSMTLLAAVLVALGFIVWMLYFR